MNRLMRRSIYLGFVIFMLLLGGGCSLEPRPAARRPDFYWDQARTLVAESRYNEAVVVLEEGAQNHPADTDLLIKIGRIYLAQQRWSPAEDAFNRALARELDNAEATAGLAEALLNQERLVEALKFWRQAARLDPSLPGIFSGVGRTRLALFDFEAARIAFLAQQDHTPDFEANWYLAALAAPLDVSAARDYLLAIPTPGATKDGPVNVTDSLATRRDYLLAALAPFTARSSPVEIAKAAGVAFVQIELWPLAVYALETAQASLSTGADPSTEAEILAFLAHALAQAGKPALDLFEEARAADPDSALPLYFEGLYLRQQGALQATEERFERAIGLDRQNAAIYFEMARTREQQGDLAAAEVWYQAAIEVAGDEADFQRALLRFYMNRNYRMAEAGLPLAEDLIEANPAEAELHDMLGWMQFLSGAPAGGRAALQKALALDPSLVSAHYHLARYYEANGQSSAAKVAYQQVIDLDRDGLFRELAYQGLQRLAGE